VEEALRRRLRFEALLGRLATQIINVPLEEIDHSMHNALATVGEFADVDRVSVMVLADDGAALELLEGWTRDPSMAEGFRGLSRVPVETVPWWAGCLAEGQDFAVPDVAALSDERDSAGHILRARGHVSTLLVPLMRRHAALGFLALANTTERRDWDADTVAMTRLVAQVFASALERKEVETALRRSEERFRALAEHSSEPILLFGGDGRLVFASPTAYALITKGERREPQPEEGAAFPRREDIHPEDRERLKALRIRVQRNPGRAFRERLRLRRERDRDRWRWLDVTSTNWLESPAIGAVVVNVRDVSEAVEQEEKLQALHAELDARVMERTAELETAVKELQAFSYSISHDLRAPLRTIVSFSQIVAERCADRLDAEDADDLQRIEAAGRRMSDLLDDLLALSRLSREPMSCARVNLSALAEDVVEAMRQREPDRIVDVRIARDVVAHGDRKLLRIALENLLGNAWKYTSRTENPVIEFAATGGEGDDAIRAYFVRDNGAGFEGEYAGKLFRAFSRLHPEHDFPGTGIGLAIVARVVARHGGRTWAEGAPGKGATFFFTLEV